MPSTYAHYRFGAEQLARMDADIRRPIQRFRRLYDVGLHGPDIFFFYNPAMETRVGKLGEVFHRQTGAKFFTRAGKHLRLEPAEPGFAYLYGVLCHYTLDSICHPFVNAKVAQGVAGHTEMETEFDRYLLEKDGKVPPHAQDLSDHVHLTPGECETVARFYATATGGNIRTSVRNMALCTKLLTAPDGMKRFVVGKGTALLGEEIRHKVMPKTQNMRCARLDEELMALYRQASERFPVLLEQLRAYLTYNAPLGEDFSADFG